MKKKFKLWDIKSKKYLTSNCGIFLLGDDGKVYFYQTHGPHGGIPKLEEVSGEYEIHYEEE